MPPEAEPGQEQLFAPAAGAGPGPDVDDFPVVGPGAGVDHPDDGGPAPSADALDALYERSYRHVYRLLTDIWGARVTPHEVHEATATLFIAKTDAR